jgi:predicted ATP-dependent endonuclease of OLD family
MSFKIEKVKIINYKSVENAEFNLESGLNILIGENGSGKSNVLQFIYSFVGVSHFLRMRNIRSPRINNLTYSFDLGLLDKKIKDKFHISIEAKVRENNEKKIEYYNILNFKRTNNNKVKFEETIEMDFKKSKERNETLFEEINVLRGLRKKYIRFNLPEDDYSNWIATPNKFVIESNGFIEFEELTYYSLFYNFEDSFEELKSLDSKEDDNESKFQNIKSEILLRFDTFKKSIELDTVLAKYSPIIDIRLNPNINVYSDDKKIFVENLIIDFKIQGNWVSWNYLSDGTKRLFYLITETLSLRNGILLIEEPELGIHPHQLYLIMDFLKEQSYTNQIIISTHSPIVLDILSPEELKNIVVTKMTSKGTKLSKLNKAEITKAKEYMNTVGDLSSYWLHSDLEKND